VTLYRPQRQTLALLLAGALAVSIGCGATDPDRIIRDVGTLERSVEGCFRILAPSGIYQPLTLPLEFHEHGLAVYFEARHRPTFNTCQAGDVIELIRIERRD
jgi:hypothetical protein